MNNLFTYGSLMFPTVWHKVVSGNHTSTPAMVRGIGRKKIRGDHYPVAYPCADCGLLAGTLYYNLSPADLRALDAFEGQYYQRAAVTATSDSDALAVDAHIYLLRPQFYSLISERDWSAREFERKHLSQFLHTYA